jgi:excisionase family DNA binding protein
MKKAKIKAQPTIPVTAGAAFISVKAAAELLSVSQVSIRRYLGQGRLKRFKFGSRTLLRHDDVMNLVREVPTTSATTAT